MLKYDKGLRQMKHVKNARTTMPPRWGLPQPPPGVSRPDRQPHRVRRRPVAANQDHVGRIGDFIGSRFYRPNFFFPRGVVACITGGKTGQKTRSRATPGERRERRVFLSIFPAFYGVTSFPTSFPLLSLFPRTAGGFSAPSFPFREKKGARSSLIRAAGAARRQRGACAASSASDQGGSQVGFQRAAVVLPWVAGVGVITFGPPGPLPRPRPRRIATEKRKKARLESMPGKHYVCWTRFRAEPSAGFARSSSVAEAGSRSR